MILRISLYAVPALILVGLTAPALASSSVYTRATIGTACESLKTPTPEDVEMGAASLKCPGYKDYPLLQHL